MKRSTRRVLTSHAGSLPRPDHLIEQNRRRLTGEGVDEAEFQQELRAAVVDVVRRQREVGIDVPGDGEYGKAMGSRVNYGAWWSYSFQRLGGLELKGLGLYDFPRPAVRAGEDRADQLRRPARPRGIPGGLRGPRLGCHHRSPPPVAGVHGPSAMSARSCSPPTWPTSGRHSTRPAWRRGS